MIQAPQQMDLPGMLAALDPRDGQHRGFEMALSWNTPSQSPRERGRFRRRVGALAGVASSLNPVFGCGNLKLSRSEFASSYCDFEISKQSYK